MYEIRRRRKFDRQFKVEAVRLVTEGGRPITCVGRELGVHRAVLYRWRKELLEDPEESFPGKGSLRPRDEELRRLQREVADLKEERDILKKALAIFSAHPK